MSHERCNAVSKEAWLPSRLIDLERYRTKGTVCLAKVIAASPAERYLTLSHRWGSHIPSSLTRPTEPRLWAGVDIHLSPQAFQDAAEICQRLHVRYLWIDSLCIQQDSREDWVREAALMHQVYKHSFLNISALAAADSSASIFTERDPRWIQEHYVTSRLKSLKLHAEGTRYRIMRLDWPKQQLSDAHLNLRALVLQERLLAPRVLHFGQQQLIWECSEADYSESDPYGLPQEMAAAHDAWFKSLDTLSGRNRMQNIYTRDSPQMAPYRMWHRVVKTYSSCGLTKSEDKLIAIAGIAKHMTSVLNDEYICGMWRRHLPTELLWYVVSQHYADHEPSFRPAQYRAPSFLWASVEGAIQPGGLSDAYPLIEILDVRLDFLTEDVTGFVKGGYLRLKGLLQTVSWGRTTPTSPNLPVDSVDERAEQRLNLTLDRLNAQIFLDEHRSYFNPATADQKTLFCVPVSVLSDDQQLWSLLLQVQDEDKGTYRRFGLMLCPKDRYDEGRLRIPLEHQAHVPAVAIKEGMHVVRLV